MFKYEIRNRNDQTDKQLDVKFTSKFTVNQKVKLRRSGCQRFKLFVK
jgi:hypothetical protein